MSRWFRVGPADMLQDGTVREVQVGGQRLLLARVGARYYATQPECPHGGGRLADGSLEGAVVTCPVHGTRFDVRTGEPVGSASAHGDIVGDVVRLLSRPGNLITYPTKSEQEQVWVRC